MMNHKIEVLRLKVEKVTQILAGRSIAVTQVGPKAFVKSNRKGEPVRVNIPYLPDDAPDSLIAAVEGFLDHEVGHLLFTDFKVFGKNAKRLRALNGVEDTFIERKMCKRFTGSADNLDNVGRFFCERLTARLEAADPRARPGMMFIPVIRALAGQSIFETFIKANRDAASTIKDAISDETAELLRAVNSTTDSVAVAERIEDELRKAMMKPEDGDDDEKGEPGEDGEPGDEKGDDGEPKKKDDKDDLFDEDSMIEGDILEETDDPDEVDEDAGDSGFDEEYEDIEDDDDAETDDDAESPEEDPDAEEDDDADPDAEAGDPDDDESGDPDDGYDDEEGDAAESDAGEEEEKGDDDEEEDDAAGSSGSSEGEEDDELDDEGSVGGTSEPGEEEEEKGEEEVEDDGDPLEDLLSEEDEFVKAIEEGLSEEAESTIESSHYAVVTKDDDLIERWTPRRVDAHVVAKLEDTTRHMLGPIQKSLERAFNAECRSFWMAGRRRGRLNNSALHRLNVGDDRVFRNRVNHQDKKNTVVSFVVDCSGSMGGPKIQLAAIAAFGLGAVLDRIKITNEIIGFTTLSGVAGGDSAYGEHIEAFGRPARYEPLHMPIFKTFEERFDRRVKERLAMAPTSLALMQNVDGECVQIAAQRLMSRKEARKIMIVISDGQPAAGGDMRKLQSHLKKVVKDLPKMGIQVFGIGVMDSAVRSYYPNYAVLHKAEDLPKLAITELQAMLLK